MVACGRQEINGSKKRASFTKSILADTLKNQKFECASLSGAACPSGVARVFIQNPEDPADSTLCSGFLNGDQKIVTNNHCLSKMKECQNTYISIYNGRSYENVRCKSIIQSRIDPGVITKKSSDFTVMEIDRPVNIKTFSVSPFLPEIEDTLTAWVIDHVSLTHARITQLNCVYSSEPHSMILNNCPAIHGNSGSPLVNRFDEIVGVIWGTTVDGDVDANTDLIKRRALNEYALATSIKHFKNYLSEK